MRVLRLRAQVEHVDHLVRARRGLRAGHAEVAAVVDERLADGEEAVEVDVLLREPDVAARRERVRRPAEDEHLAARDPDQVADGVDRGRLAGAVRPEQAEERSLRDLEVEVLERERAVVVALRQRAQLEQPASERAAVCGRTGARSTRGTRPSGSAPTTTRCRGTSRPSARGPRRSRPAAPSRAPAPCRRRASSGGRGPCGPRRARSATRSRPVSSRIRSTTCEVLLLVRAADVVDLARLRPRAAPGRSRARSPPCRASCAPGGRRRRRGARRRASAFSTHSGISFSGYWRGP